MSKTRMTWTCKKTTNFDLVQRLDKTIFPECYEIDLSAMWWLLKVDGRVAGFCGLKLESCGDYKWGYLVKAGVLPPFRGFGLQKAMIRVRDREAQRIGLDMNITYTSEDNVESANSLISCGYRLYLPQNPYGLKRSLYFSKRLRSC